MTIGILLLTFVCVAFAAPAGAATTWAGAQLHFPVPAGDIGDTQLGVDAGASITQMLNPRIGTGVDLIYHYWPASTEYTAAFDRYLRSSRFEALDGSTWAFTAVQFTAHVKFVAPAGQRHTSWAQVGAGAYRLNRNLDERWPADTYAWIVGPGRTNIVFVPGAYGGVGFDLHVSSSVALGLDATFHYLWTRDKGDYGAYDLPGFTAFTVGTHLMFGWE